MYYLLTFNDDYADEHNVPALECMTQDEYEKWLEEPCTKLNPNYEEELIAYRAKKIKGFYDKPIRGESALRAKLGNNGNNFEDGYERFTYNKDLLCGAVKKYEVSEDFYKTFKRADLAGLSLCNVFEKDRNEEAFYDEDYEDPDNDKIEADDI